MKKEILKSIFISVVVVFVIWMIREIVIRYMVTTLCNMYYQKNTNNLRNLLQYCSQNIPYYQGLEPTLHHFPIVDKKIINKDPHLFMSSESYNRRIVSSQKTAGNSWTEKEETTDSILYHMVNSFQILMCNASIAQVTGGSSNEYFHQWLDFHDIKMGSYSFLKGLMNMGFTPGKRIFLYYFHGANTVKLLKTLTLFSNQICVLVPKLNIHGDITEEGFYEFVHTIEKFQPFVVISFPSLIYRICEITFMKDYHFQYIPPTMDLSGDMLFTCQYEFITSIFSKCDVRMSYGTVETGQVAQQIPRKMFHYIVYDDIAVIEQGPDNTLMITVLHYRTLPMVRYHIDDKGSVVCKNNHTEIHNLVGKSIENFNYIDLDHVINQYNKQNPKSKIINIRINKEKKQLHVKTILVTNFDIFPRQLFSTLFPEYHLVFEKCLPSQCSTIDRYDRKNTPLLLQYKY